MYSILDWKIGSAVKHKYHPIIFFFLKLKFIFECEIEEKITRKAPYPYHGFWQGIRRWICDDLIVNNIWKFQVNVLHNPNCDFDNKVLLFLRKYFVGKLNTEIG